MVDELAALRLLIEWGADEALAEEPISRFAAAAPVRADAARRVVAGPAAPAPIAAATLEALYDAWDGLRTHPLRTTATHTVRPSGNPAAKVLLLGEAPDGDDDRSGAAFSGAAGRLLDRVFGSAGFGRDGMLLATVVPWRPPGNRPLSEGEVRACLPFVHRLLALVRPERLVLVGAAAVRALTGESGTPRRLRGRWLPVQVDEVQLTVPAMALPPLEQWLHNSATKQALWADLLMLQDAVTTGSK